MGEPQTMTKQQVSVVIDDREDDEVIADLATEFVTHDDVEEWRVDILESADLDINGIGFERKTISDYVSSITEGRFDEQVIKMKQQYEHAYILVEGDLHGTKNPPNSQIASASVRGHMASMTAREGISVILCSDRALLADMAVRLARKHLEESGREHLPKSKVDGSDEPTAKRMYGCIRGIGPGKAATLYEEWPSIMEFMSEDHPVERVAELDGFGEETAKKVAEGFM